MFENPDTISDENSKQIIFEVGVPGKRRVLRTVKLEVVPLTPNFKVSIKDEVLSFNFNWSNEEIYSAFFSSLEEAINSYELKKNECQAKHMPESSIKPKERITARPIGITDPDDPNYINCNILILERTSSRPYSCYVTGDIKYTRLDGTPLNENDFKALRKLNYGQVSYVNGNPGDMVCNLHYQCDSSD